MVSAMTSSAMLIGVFAAEDAQKVIATKTLEEDVRQSQLHPLDHSVCYNMKPNIGTLLCKGPDQFMCRMFPAAPVSYTWKGRDTSSTQPMQMMLNAKDEPYVEEFGSDAMCAPFTHGCGPVGICCCWPFWGWGEKLQYFTGTWGCHGLPGLRL